MNTKALDTFVEKIVNLNASTPGMGSASSGIIGSGSTADPAVNQLKEATLAFASVYRSDPNNTKHLSKLADEIAGFLQVAQAMSVIDKAEGEKLNAELYNLI